MVHRIDVVLRVCLVVDMILSVWAALSILLFPYGVVYGEALLIDQAKHIIAGQALYKASVQEPPYVTANYPPIYPLLIAGVVTITRLPFFQVGRIISLIAAIVSGFVIGLLAYRLSGSRMSGLLAATLFLGHPLVTTWSSLARVDLVALGFSLLALWILYCRWNSWPWLVAAMICLLVSFYTRQTYLLAAPLASSVWLWHNDRRRSLAFVVLLATAYILSFGLLNFITEGGFYFSTVVANMGAYHVERTLVTGGYLLFIWPVVAAITCIAVAQTLIIHIRKSGPQDVVITRQPFLFYGLIIYSAGAFISALTAGKLGSDVNYFLELMVALSIWTAGALVWLPAWRAVRQWIILLLLLCQILWVLAVGLWIYRSTIVVRWNNIARYNELYQQVRDAATQGQVLSDDYLDMVVLAGQPIYYDPFLYGQLYAMRLWEPSGLAREVANQRFSLILIGGPTLHKECCWPPPVVDAIENNYEITEQSGLVDCRPAKK